MLDSSRKLNILISLLYYFPHRTGLTIHVQSVAEELARRGHTVTVLTARYHKSLPRDEEVVHNGVRVIRLWAPIKISRGMVMPAYPWAAYLLMRQADIVSIHTPMAETALVTGLAKLAGVNIVATHHGDLVLPQDKLMNRLIRDAMFSMYKYMARNAAQLIGYSQDYAENSYYLKPFLHKTTVNYPPVSMPAPRPERVRHLRQQWQVNDAPIIGYAGRFVEEKRPDLAIQALKVVNEGLGHAHTRLVFAGEYDIPYENTWQKFQPLVQDYREQVQFLGLLTDPQDMADFYAACDVIVLPSDTMLSGTPMVMTDIAGGRVPVQVTGMGKLAQQGDWQSIGAALVEVLTHRQQYVKPRETIESIFSFQETVDRYEQVFLRHARPERT
jgi:glycosyltransferase involved in cell wall biosynthesis